MPTTPAKLSATEVKRWLPKRAADSHKGDYGHVLIVAGSRGMSGAAVLVARGALRSGAGLVTVAIVESERAVVTHTLPEALTLSLPETSEGTASDTALAVLQEYLNQRDINALAVGPGLSIHPSIAQIMKSILKDWEQPLVLDADGLNNVTTDDLRDYPQLIITPHPGELARLCRIERDAVQRDRARVAENIARDLHLVCVLKGHHTVLSDGKKTRLNPTGNPAMATGGMGDVLTGIIAGLLAQGIPTFESACTGVFLHGLAGDLARISDRGLLASDLADTIPKALFKIGVR
jgi:hydroxyethylthiazole kinase-like uncharacterized protein yjeF